MPAFVTGGLYMVADSKLVLLPDPSTREVHAERRRFVILGGAERNQDDKWPVVLGCPVSSATTYRTEFDVQLAAGEAGTAKKCWIRIPCLQPLQKSDLQDLTGTLSAERLEETLIRVIDYMDMVKILSPPPDPGA
jgi:mRNA-degrading endonuclease toxin of MazEF toxin-antitoxin module